MTQLFGSLTFQIFCQYTFNLAILIKFYFLYRLVQDQKDVGYKKLLSSDIISDAQRILLEYLDLPPQHAQEQDHSQGMLDITRCWCTSCAGLTTLSPGCSILTVQYTFSILSLRPLLNILETKQRSQRTNSKRQVFTSLLKIKILSQCSRHCSGWRWSLCSGDQIRYLSRDVRTWKSCCWSSPSSSGTTWKSRGSCWSCSTNQFD